MNLVTKRFLSNFNKLTNHETVQHCALKMKEKIKALAALMGQLSLSVGWENGPERGLNTVSFNP